MNPTATSPKHPQTTPWSPVMGMFHGMECSYIGSNPEAITGRANRLGKGFDPMAAGR